MLAPFWIKENNKTKGDPRQNTFFCLCLSPVGKRNFFLSFISFNFWNAQGRIVCSEVKSAQVVLFIYLSNQRDRRTDEEGNDDNWINKWMDG